METINVKQAAEAYKVGDFSKALSLYRSLALQYGNRLFYANIRLCERKLAINPSENLTSSDISALPVKYQSFVDGFTSNVHQVTFPPTNNKFKSYIAEAVIQTQGDITSLGYLQAKYQNLSKDFVDGVLQGLRLKNIIDKKPTILIAGHDLRFVQPFIGYFSQYFEVLIDQWSATNKHDPSKSTTLLNKADLIWCEWCCGNAVWYSNNVTARQKLVVRLHKFEINTTYPSQVDWSKVQAMIFISDGMRTYANKKHRIDCKQYLLFNGFDVDAVEHAYTGIRDKHAIALLGYVPYIKRLDRGIDFFEKAWSRDKQCTFHIKGKAAQELQWVWQKEQSFFEEQYERLRSIQNLGAKISQEPYDDSVHRWLGQKGFILSASDIEGSHQAVAEGMACGTIPLIFGEWVDRYQARFIYPSELCFKNEDAALEYMFYLLGNATEYDKISQRVKEFAHENFNDKTILHGSLSILEGREPELPYVPIPQAKRIVVFTDLCINVIDGSTVWLMSLVELLLLDRNLEIILISREPSRILTQFSKFEDSGRFILEVFPDQYSDGKIDSYVTFLSSVIEKYQASRTIVRCVSKVADKLLPILGSEKTSSLIYYLIGEAYPDEVLLRTVHAIFMQTEESQRRFENHFPAWAKRKLVRILRPMIPDEFSCEALIPGNKLIISYTGKISKGYMAREMIDFIQIAPSSVSFLICAAKYHRPDGEEYIKTVKDGLSKAVQSGNVVVFNSLARSQVIELLKNTHLGWSIRSEQFNNSSEISTKVIEYCSLGKPVLLNKYPSNVALLGDDYPLYCNDVSVARFQIDKLLANKRLYEETSEKCRVMAKNYRLNEIYIRIIDVL
ncbi:hypothetical protein SAMN05216379_1073 [Nitrosomonas eutropha]|uniref:glycosyltransferase family 4 protein n=1 Tax=Nitrosomonas eutropha TaxID=916 RepID=UPI000887939E|nr:glycosyltransferase family 4 protein [Nitrosomonas eutropha]SCX11236.1 hypothetical protein SAMN05216379_1073 [Nitrosomonas eutropha]